MTTLQLIRLLLWTQVQEDQAKKNNSNLNRWLTISINYQNFDKQFLRPFQYFSFRLLSTLNILLCTISYLYSNTIKNSWGRLDFHTKRLLPKGTQVCTAICMVTDACRKLQLT